MFLRKPTLNLYTALYLTGNIYDVFAMNVTKNYNTIIIYFKKYCVVFLQTKIKLIIKER